MLGGIFAKGLRQVILFMFANFAKTNSIEIVA